MNAEIDVFISNYTLIDSDIFQQWIEGYSSSEASFYLKQKCFGQFMGAHIDLIVSDILDQYRTYSLIERLLHAPVKLSEQSSFQLEPHTRTLIIEKYYSIDDSVAREILGKKLSSRYRKDLDEVSEKTFVKLKSCRLMAVVGVLSLNWENIPSTGIYFRNLGELRQKTGKVSIVTNIDCQIEDQINVISHFVTNINENCIIEIPECIEIIQKNKLEILNLRKNLRVIYQLLGVDRRFKRGLVNFVGSGLKFLFGTLDSEDVEHYEEAIRITRENSEYVHKSQQEEIKILDSLNKQNQIVKDAYLELGNLTNNMMTNLEKLAGTVNQERSSRIIKEYFIEFKLKTYFLINHTELIIDQIIEFLFLRDKIIYPIIIEPKKFIQILKESDRESDMLFTPNLELYNSIVQEINPVYYLRDNRLVVVLSVPIVEKIKSDVYEVINIPFKI